MEKFALHTMFIGFETDTYELGDVKIFDSLADAFNERDVIIKELHQDYEFDLKEAVNMNDDGKDTNIDLYDGAFYQIKIQNINL